MARSKGPEVAVPLSDNLRGAGYMLIAMATFTLGDACMKTVAEQMPLYQAVTLRGMITVPLLVLVAWLTGGLRFRDLSGCWGTVTWRSLGELGATLTFFYALVSMPLGTLSAILQSAPLAVTAGAAFFMGEKVGWRRALAIAVGFVGVLIIIRPGPEGLSPHALVALVSVGFIVLRDLNSRLLPPAAPTVTVALIAGALVTLACGLLSLREPWVPVPAQSMPLILLAGCLVNIGYIFVIRVMRVGEVGFTTPFRYTSLVWAVALGWVIWGDIPDALTVLGAGIVVASGVFTLLREARLGRMPPR